MRTENMNNHVNYHDEMRRRMKIKVHLEVGEILMGGRSVFHPEMLAQKWRILVKSVESDYTSLCDRRVTQ